MSSKADDSFIAAIESWSPIKMAVSEMLPEEPENVAKSSPIADSDASAAKPPVQRSPRIEDSVEALDALEEALDKMGESLPILADEPDSPVMQMKAPRLDATQPPQPAAEILKQEIRDASPIKGKVEKPPSKMAKGKPTANTVSTTKTIAPHAARPVTSRPAPTGTLTRSMGRSTAQQAATTTAVPAAPLTNSKTIRAKASVSKPASKPASSPTKPKPTRQPWSGASATKTVPRTGPSSTARPRPRVSSVSKAPFVPTKSAKVPTVSTFSLPGEAISARLKTQREERLKREDEAAKERRGFKARPVRQSSASSQPVAAAGMKSTAASRARLSTVKPLVDAKEGAGSKSQIVKRTSSVTTVVGAKKTTPATNPFAAAVKQSPTSPRTANMRAPRNSPAMTAASATTAVGATKTTPATNPFAAAVGQSPTAPRTANMRAPRNPPATMAATMTKVRTKASPAKTELQLRREKEEAAKKARADAAERGRAASRVWAEKMRRKSGKQASAAN